MINDKEKNQHIEDSVGNESKQSSGDKSSPMASSGRTNISGNTNKEANNPGTKENAAGENQSAEKETNDEEYHARIGSQPIPDDLIKKGD